MATVELGILDQVELHWNRSLSCRETANIRNREELVPAAGAAIFLQSGSIHWAGHQNSLFRIGRSPPFGPSI